MSERKVDILTMLANVPLRAPTGKKRILVATTDHNVSLPAELDATAAAELIGTMAVDVPEAVRGFVENAIAFAVPAQTRLGRVARDEIPADEEELRSILVELDRARQLLDVAANALRTSLEVRTTAPGGAA